MQCSESAVARIREGANAIKYDFHVLNCAAEIIAALRDSLQGKPFSKSRKAWKQHHAALNLQVGSRSGRVLATKNASK